MSAISDMKIVADIAEVTSRIWKTIRDNSQKEKDRDAKIKELEKQLEELKNDLKKSK